MFTLYGSKSPIYLKTVVAAEEMNAPYKIVKVDLLKGESRTPEHRARHPFGKVPVLEHKGRFIYESNAIMRYMANELNSSLYPKDNYERAMVDQWVDYFSLQAGRWITQIWYQRVLSEKYFNKPADQKVIEENLALLQDVMPVLDRHFSENKFVSGSNISIADINAHLLCQGWRDAGIQLNDFTNFIRWNDEMAARPSVKKAWQTEGRGLRSYLRNLRPPRSSRNLRISNLSQQRKS